MKKPTESSLFDQLHTAQDELNAARAKDPQSPGWIEGVRAASTKVTAIVRKLPKLGEL